MRHCHALWRMILFIKSVFYLKSVQSATLLVFSRHTCIHVEGVLSPLPVTITWLFFCSLAQIKVQSAEYGAFFTGESTPSSYVLGCINKTESTLHRLPGNIRAMSDDNAPEDSPCRMISINAQQEGNPLAKVTEYPLGRSGVGGLVTHFSFTAVRSDNEDGRRKQ